jgi:hypothetical protein
MESRRPFILNPQDYRDSKEQNFTDLTCERNAKVTSGQPSLSRHTLRDGNGNSQSIVTTTENDNALLGILQSKGFALTSTKKLARLHDVDEFEAEMTVISQALAYFEMSSRRIIEIMPMIFETVFAADFVADLRKNLPTTINFVGESGYETCKRYGVDEPIILAKRKDLVARMKSLSEALEIVSKLFKS